jgi:hypothetical protein
MQKYKATGNLTLFDEEERQQRLSKIGNPLTEKDKGQERRRATG